jgi:protein-L-isoaspartate(D-aspartate) O-methyltransferase
MMPLDAARRFFAAEIQAVANLQTAALVEALATVPRESFLGPGPWLIATPDARRPGHVTYRPTHDADPRHVYHNVLLAIDPSRALNNGHPSTLAACLDALRLSSGMAVAHVGCGLGYYTALAAAVVGASGRVLAIDLDRELAARAARNLAGLHQVRVVCGDGTSVELPPCDAILVNAGFTHPLPHWLDALTEAGRLLLPITMQVPGGTTSIGAMCLVTRSGQHYSASPLSSMAIFASPTGRDDELDGPIRQAFATGRWSGIRSVRRDVHTPASTCCIHGRDVCLSSEE